MSLSEAYARLPHNSRGALWMLASAAAFTVMTMLIKLLGDEYPAALQAFYRQAASLIVLAPLILRNPRAAFHTRRFGLLIARSLATSAAMVLGFYAYQMMPLADANALSFTRTLWLVPLAAFVLKEAIGPRRIAATGVGFLGALLMLQPAASGAFGWPAVAALASAFLLALSVTGVKFMTRDHTTTTLLVWSAVLGLLFILPPALLVWRWPTPMDLALLGLMGVLGAVTQACYIKGMSQGDAAVMAPIDYTRLVFAVVLGYLWFGETPNAVTMIGASIVIVSTVYITWREAQVDRELRNRPAPEA